MKKKYVLTIFAISSVFSTWLYLQYSNITLEKKITSHEWQSNVVLHFSPETLNIDRPIGVLDKVDIKSNVKYFSDHTYLRVSHTTTYEEKQKVTSVMNILESGKWKFRDNYLLIDPQEFKDTQIHKSFNFTDKQFDMIKNLLIQEAEQSYRVDIINPKTILLTNLHHESKILSSN